MNAVVGALLENLKSIRIIFDDTCEPFTKDTKHTADSKEISVSGFIESFFPPTYRVKKGPIYNLDSNTNEIDCVILAPNHPILVTPKREVILAEGVYAAIEVKPDISSLTEKSEFHRGLKQLQSVKQLERNLPVLFTEGYVPEEFHRIPTVMFSRKAQSAVKIIDYLKGCVNMGDIKAKEIPDIIVVLDKYIVFHSMCVEKTIFSEWVKSQSINGEVYIHLNTGVENTLGMFLILLYCVKPPEPTISENFLLNYLKIGLNNFEFTVY